jgi:hypothetical protein
MKFMRRAAEAEPRQDSMAWMPCDILQLSFQNTTALNLLISSQFPNPIQVDTTRPQFVQLFIVH